METSRDYMKQAMAQAQAGAPTPRQPTLFERLQELRNQMLDNLSLVQKVGHDLLRPEPEAVVPPPPPFNPDGPMEELIDELLHLARESHQYSRRLTRIR